MKNNAPCQGKQCPKGQVLIATTCQCISSQEKYKSPTKVDKSVKQISKEEYNKIRNLKNGGTMKAKMKTGGMVNPNAKIQAGKVAGSKGVKSGVNPKAAASKVAKGRSGGTSVAPKTAIPKKEDGGPVMTSKMKSKIVKTGIQQAKDAAKKGKAGKI